MHLIPLFYSSYKQGHNEGRNNAQGAKFLVDVNTLRTRLIQAVRKKQLIRTWLCARIFPLLYALQTR